MDNVKMRGFMKLTRIDVALEKFFSQVSVERLAIERLPTTDILARVLAEDVVAESDLPNFDRSAVDGYALRSEETFGASRTNPVIFDILGTVEIGSPSKLVLGKQQALRIATGAPMPSGADSVVMVEFTEKVGDAKVEVYNSLTPGENVSSIGEDVKKGERILSRGTLLQPQDIGILVALGNKVVEVVKKPKVAVLSTGNELVELGENVELGKIIDTNRPILLAMVRALGGEPFDVGIAQDRLEEIRSRIAFGLENSDLVLVSGGTSVGAGDLAPEAINSLGRPGIIIHGMSIRPGRPTAMAAIGSKPIVLLPGFPVAAMVSFNTFVQPIILKMLGTSSDQFEGRKVRARMLRRVPSSLGNRTFARVTVRRRGDNYVAEPLRTSGSGVISSMIRANGFVIIPEEKEGLEEGEEVEITLLRPLVE